MSLIAQNILWLILADGMRQTTAFYSEIYLVQWVNCKREWKFRVQGFLPKSHPASMKTVKQSEAAFGKREEHGGQKWQPSKSNGFC